MQALASTSQSWVLRYLRESNAEAPNRLGGKAVGLIQTTPVLKAEDATGPVPVRHEVVKDLATLARWRMVAVEVGDGATDSHRNNNESDEDEEIGSSHDIEPKVRNGPVECNADKGV